MRHHIKHKVNFFEKKGKGQVLVILALVITTLVAMMGMAIDAGYLYVSYARLHRAVDAAALSATAQFTKHADPSDLFNAAQQFLALNNEPITSLTVATCYDTFVFNGTTVTPTHYSQYVDEANMGGNAAEEGNGIDKLCTVPRRKLIRVTATESVPTFFLAVIGVRAFPITTSATSEAASLEMALIIDQSESMAWYPKNVYPRPPNNPGDPANNHFDPSWCNAQPANTDWVCQPFTFVKQSAEQFITKIMYAPYDRAGVVSFSKHAYIWNPATKSPFDRPEDITLANPGLSNISQDVIDTIDQLKVTEGGSTLTNGVACDHAYDNGVNSYGGPGWPNGFDYSIQAWWGLTDPHYAPWTMPNVDQVPCRQYNVVADAPWNNNWPGDPVGDAGENLLDPGTALAPNAPFTPIFVNYWCPQLNLPIRDGSRCQTSNIGEGLLRTAQLYNETDDLRPEALWVTVLLTDGNANAAYYPSPVGVCDPNDLVNYNLDVCEHPTNPFCPAGERSNTGGTPYCRDTNVLYRHCLGPVTDKYPCKDQNYGVLDPTTCQPIAPVPIQQAAPPNKKGTFYWPCTWYTTYSATTAVHNNVEDTFNYDADDFARDQADALAIEAHVTVFAIGLNQGVSSEIGVARDANTPLAGESLLQYIATIGGTDSFYPATNTGVGAVFLKIASKIATRLTH